MFDCVACKEKRNYLILFYILVHNSSPALVDIKQTLHYKVAIEYI